jgi:hypothetical protein
MTGSNSYDFVITNPDDDIKGLEPHIIPTTDYLSKSINNECFGFEDRVVANFAILEAGFTNVTCVDNWDYVGIGFMTRKNYSFHEEISQT